MQSVQRPHGLNNTERLCKIELHVAYVFKPDGTLKRAIGVQPEWALNLATQRKVRTLAADAEFCVIGVRHNLLL
jgi:hypothetical protein